MSTREIERSQWNTVMAELSDRCLNRPVTVEVIGADTGDQLLVNHGPFLGIAPELKGSEACSVDIEVGRVGSTDSFMHEVSCATKVLVKEDDNGRPLAVDLEGEDPSTHARLKVIMTGD